LIGTALTDEHFAFANDQGSGDESKGGAGGSGVGFSLSLFHTSSVNVLKEMRAGAFEGGTAR
jgi:hypothetical protein